MAVCVSGCGSAAEPGLPAAEYIHAGADPRREARAVARMLGKQGYTVERRLEGKRFVALSLRRGRDGSTAVRVLTRQGIGLALDAPSRGMAAAERVSLLVPDDGRHDLDGDGRAEIVIRVKDAERERTCLVIAQVMRNGQVVEMPVQGRRQSRNACIERLQDVGGDATPEALLVKRHVTLRWKAVPTVVVPLVARGGRWRSASASALQSFWQEEQRRRKQRLEQARQALAIDKAYRLAVELAAIAREQGKPAKEQLATFDEALRGLVLTDAQAKVVKDARARIEQGWKASPSSGAMDDAG